MSSPTSDASDDSFGLLVTALVLHVICWCAFLFVLIFLTPRAKEVFENFGVEVPAAVALLMTVSDPFVRYWYLLVPILLMAVVKTTCIAFDLATSRSAQRSWAVAGAVVPILLAAASYLLLRITVARLVEAIS